jgi:hypothetical protein
MAHDWIAQGLQQIQEHEEQHRLASERRLHQATVIKQRGPELMRRLVAEVGAAVDEYRQGVRLGSTEIELEMLSDDGFCVTRTKPPKVSLECRPGYETQTVHCNMTRSDDQAIAPQEFVFSLGMTVDDSDNIVLRNENRPLESVDEVVEFLLKPVLFPALDQDL